MDKEKLWGLRLKVIDAHTDLVMHKSIKSAEDKISGYTDRGILINPEAMQNTITLLEKARETNDTIADFGRSKLKVKKTNDKETENMIANFGRSVCTSEEPTALDRVEESGKKNRVGKSKYELAFIDTMKELEDFMEANKMKHSFRCKIVGLDEESFNKMVQEADELDIEDPNEKQIEKIKILRSVKKMKKQKIFDFCDKKPYQCLVCPFYYSNVEEFQEMKDRKKEQENKDEE